MPETSYEVRLEQLLAARFTSFKEPLGALREMLRESPAGAQVAVRGLLELRKRHPHAITVGQELVLALLYTGREREAEQELITLGREFRDHHDEETLSRLGRLHRDRGDRHLKVRNAANDQLALRAYEEAWKWYDLAFAPPSIKPPREGYYPGINRASLFLLRAWLHPANSPERQRLTQEAGAAARRLLDREKTHRWAMPEPDEEIWHRATRGEANLLLGEIALARDWYTAAFSLCRNKQMFQDSMRDQLVRLRPALLECLGLPEAGLTSILAVFTPSPELVQPTPVVTT